MQVEPEDLDPLTFASHTYETFHLLMPLYGKLHLSMVCLLAGTSRQSTSAIW
jgi:hypothetical protein